MNSANLGNLLERGISIDKETIIWYFLDTHEFIIMTNQVLLEPKNGFVDVDVHGDDGTMERV